MTENFDVIVILTFDGDCYSWDGSIDVFEICQMVLRLMYKFSNV